MGDADDLVPMLVAFADRPRDRAAIEAMLAERLGAPSEPGLWRALRMMAPLVHAPRGSLVVRSAPRSSPRRRADADGRGDVSTRLVRRYLAAFGPATRQDFARFAMLRQAEVVPAFDGLQDELVAYEGAETRDATSICPVGPLPDGDAPAPPRLLPMWDSVLLGHADRGRLIPDAYRSKVIRRNGDVLPVVLVDGFAAGVWRLLDHGVEVTAFHALDDDAWDGIEHEARALRPLLEERDPQVYGRFGHWWRKGLAGVHVRVVGA